MIEMKDLVMGYHKPITNPINLKISDNKWLGVVGKNGIGKTTLFKTFLGIIKPLRGEILIFNQKPENSNNLISYIPQERELNLPDKMTGYSLVKYTLSSPQIKQQKKIDRNFLNNLIDLVDVGSYIHQPFLTLSGGQKKRVFLVQSLISHPKLLLLDEPLADLDPKSKRAFIASLHRIREQRELNVLMISHEMREVYQELDGFMHFSEQQLHYHKTIENLESCLYV